MIIYVSQREFNKMGDIISCGTISEKGCSKGSINLNGESFVITGGGGDGNGGWSFFWAMRAIPLKDYSGSLKPLSYNDHHYERLEGRRKTGYDGILISSDGQKVVLSGETITFKPKSCL